MQQLQNNYTKSRNLFFRDGTLPEIKKLLNDFFENGRTIKILQGSQDTGIAWWEENDVMGTVGRSTGENKVPLLVEKGEYGGGQISTTSLLGIKDVTENKWVYLHPKFQFPVIENKPSTQAGYKFDTFINGSLHASHKTAIEAINYVAMIFA